MINPQALPIPRPKIVAPRRAPGLIGRPRLLDVVAQVERRQLTVIKAGPGFGKTTLAASWVEHCLRSGKTVAWLTLDDEDDEPARFLLLLSQALRHAAAAVGTAAIGLLSDIALVSFSTVVATWINDLSDRDEDFFLFLDDFHRITDPDITAALSYLLRYAPDRFHLVLTGLSEPALPLGRLRARNQVFEIDSEDLRFDVEETQRFLQQETRAVIDTGAVRLLQAKTAGWPAVLRIVAAMLDRPGLDLPRYLAGLSGAMRPIGAYIAEFLDGLPSDRVAFMLETAVLERFCAPLCAAVTGLKASRALLDALNGLAPVLTPLDPEAQWFCYHRLLRDYLLQRLAAERGEDVAKLHRRAYRWLAGRALFAEAVRHALAAGDMAEAIAWADHCAMERVKTGDVLTLLSWRRQFPDQLVRSRTRIALAVAWGLALAMRFEAALEGLEAIEHEAAAGAAPDAIACECQAIRAIVTSLGDDTAAAVPLAQACLTGATDPWTHNAASLVLRFGHWKAGEIEKFHAAPWVSFSDGGDRRNIFATVYRLCLQGLVEFHQLRLAGAERHYAEAIRLAALHAEPGSAAAALPASLMARIRYEQDRFDEAEALIVDHAAVIDATGMLDAVLSAYAVRFRIAGSSRNIERGTALLDQLENLGHERRWGRIVAVALMFRMRLHLADGRLSESSACLKRLVRLTEDFPAPTRCAWSDIADYAAFAQALQASAEERHHEAAAILHRLEAAAEACHNGFYALRVAIKRAEVLLAADEPAEAARLFRAVLQRGAAAGLYRTILDESPDVGPLLQRFQDEAQRSGVAVDLLPYAATLHAGWQRISRTEAPAPLAPAALGPAAPLSPRERVVLEQIGEGRSNKEIARELGITPETVKTHVKNIFGKLAVERRAQAVLRARSLGLIHR